MSIKLNPAYPIYRGELQTIAYCSSCINCYRGNRIVTIPPKYEEGDEARVYFMAVCVKMKKIVKKLELDLENRSRQTGFGSKIPIPPWCPLEDDK